MIFQHDDMQLSFKSYMEQVFAFWKHPTHWVLEIREVAFRSEESRRWLTAVTDSKQTQRDDQLSRQDQTQRAGFRETTYWYCQKNQSSEEVQQQIQNLNNSAQNLSQQSLGLER